MNGRRALVQAVVAITLFVLVVGAALTGEGQKSGWLQIYSRSVFLAMAVLWLWDHVLWRLPPAQAIPGVPRDLRGTWKGTLVSLWRDPTTGAAPPSKEVYLVVRQTCFRLSITLLTEESSSRSSVAELRASDDGVTLSYMYFNRPDARVEFRSKMHNGAAFLDAVGRPANRLRGKYWTDRETKGEIDFSQRKGMLAGDYRHAATLFR